MKTKPSGNPTRIKHCLIMIFYEHLYSILLYILLVKSTSISMKKPSFVIEFQDDNTYVEKLLMYEMISFYFMRITSRFFENLLRYSIYSYQAINKIQICLVIVNSCKSNNGVMLPRIEMYSFQKIMNRALVKQYSRHILMIFASAKFKYIFHGNNYRFRILLNI